MEMNRKTIVYNGDEIISQTFRDMSWDEVRDERNMLLMISDWRFMSDQSPSDEWIAYRVFLRDLPQNYDEANDAADALNEYEKPE
tara:strand:- start:66 stop:320 length:255 start_codon:yes stop_codon:yes gene_type:complete